MNDK
jgi:hypothetical protein